MSDDRPRDPGTPDGPAGTGSGSGAGAGVGAPDQGATSSYSLDKSGDAPATSYGYGPPSYGSGTSGSSQPQDPGPAYAPTGYGQGSSYDENASYGQGGATHDPNAGYGQPSGPVPNAAGYGAASGPSPYGSPSPYGTPPPAGKKSHTGLIIGLVAGGLVIVLGLIGGIVLIAGGGGDKPADTVKAYLQALADGDAAKALDQGEKPPNTAFVTSAALKTQQGIAKIGSVSVSEGYSTSRSARVSATYTFGKKQADESFSLTKIGGKWKLDDTVYPIDLSNLDDVPGLTLLGIDASNAEKAYVFPGPLTWGSSNEYLTVEERDADDFTLSPSDGTFSYSTLETALSDKGEQAVAKAVDDYIGKCAESKSLTPTDCPQAEYDYQAVDGTATWTPPADLGSLEYRSSSPATEVYVTGDLRWSVTYTATEGGTQKQVTADDVDGSIYGTVDLTQDPPVFTE